MLKEIRGREALRKILRGLTIGVFAAALGTILWFGGIGGEAIGAEREDEYIQSLPEDMREMMLAAVRLGQEGIDETILPGVEEQDFYFATQVMIWEIQQQLRVLQRDGEGRVTGTARVDAQGMSRDDFFNLVRGRPGEKCYDYLEDRMDDYLLEAALGEEEGPGQLAPWEFPPTEFGDEEGLWYFVPPIPMAEPVPSTEPIQLPDSRSALLARSPLTQSVALEARSVALEAPSVVLESGRQLPSGETGTSGESCLRPEPENPVKTPEPTETSTWTVAPQAAPEEKAAAPKDVPIKRPVNAAWAIAQQKEQPAFNRLKRAEGGFDNPSGDGGAANTALLTLLIFLTAAGIASLLFALRREG